MATKAKELPKGKKVWYKDPMILGVAGVGGVAGLYVLAKNRGAAGTGQGTAADISSTGAIPGAPYSSLGTDFYNAVQDSTSALQDKLSGLQESVQDVNLQISKLPTTAQPSPPGPAVNPRFIAKGKYANVIAGIGAKYKSPGVLTITPPKGWVLRGNKLVYVG